MLTRNVRRNFRPLPIAGQRGIVLFIAIIIVVIMTLAGVALLRSIDTSNLIAGNLAFQQAAAHQADTGIEAAVAWLEANKTGTTLHNDDASNGYAANGLNPSQNPASGQSWDAYWAATASARAKTLSSNNDNTVSYVIDRLCALAGTPTNAKCAASKLTGTATGNSEGAGDIGLNASSLTYYRITARVAGPRSTVSYVQATVAL